VSGLVGDILVALGVFFVLVGSIGVLRLPDFYSRAHAATKPDTLGLILAMIGLAVHHGISITSAKLLLIVILVFIANPAAVHVLGRSAIRSGLQPWIRREGGRS
jgi:multicomponent Na+:H+ antiporter subunit G